MTTSRDAIDSLQRALNRTDPISLAIFYTTKIKFLGVVGKEEARKGIGAQKFANAASIRWQFGPE